MNVAKKCLVGGLIGLLAAVSSPAYAGTPCSGGGNCHFGTTQNIPPRTPVSTYRPGYVNDGAIIKGYQLNLNGGVPVTQVNLQQLRTPHVLGVTNGSGGFSHTAAVLPGAGGVKIIQRFDTNSSKYTAVFTSGQQFINQTVYFGGQSRQPYLTQPNNVRIFCVGGSCGGRH